MSEVVRLITLAAFRRLKRRPNFLGFTFSPGERRYALTRPHPDEHLSARYAAKLALLELLAWAKPPVALRELEIARKPHSPPEFHLSARVRQALGLPQKGPLWLSLTHERDRAAAYVVFRAAERVLTVTADDFNLAPGVSRGILDAHERGIVSNTSFLVNYPFPSAVRAQLARARRLAVGLHVNLVRGKPVAGRSRVRALLTAAGEFTPRPLAFYNTVSRSALESECRAQFKRFSSLLGAKPHHLDTHHHTHRHPRVLAVVMQLAREHGIPVRHTGEAGRHHPLFLADRVWGSLDRAGIWSQASLAKKLQALPKGVTEVACHPGRVDRLLATRSSFLGEREKETAVFCAPGLRRLLARERIWLASSRTLGSLREHSADE